ncbi:MAG: isoprenylcysteine carboxylmethyltransferase family protein [Bacteroidota bacterium]
MNWCFTIALVLYYGLHSLLASTRVKHYLQQRWVSARYYRLAYNGVAVLMLLPVGYFYSTGEGQILLPQHWSHLVLGGLGFGFGLYLIRAAMQRYDWREFSGTAQLANPKGKVALGDLNTEGWNGVVRHPLYLGAITVAWSCVLLHPTALLLTAALVTTGYSYVGAKWEEAKLLAAFGDRYREYQKRVPMLLPFPRLNS